MDWHAVGLRMNRCGQSLWPAGLRRTPEWFLSRLTDYDFWFIWRGHGFLRPDDKRVIPLRRGTCLFMRPGSPFEVWQQDESPLGIHFFHFNLHAPDGTGAVPDADLPDLVLETFRSDFFETLTSRIIQIRQEQAFMAPAMHARSEALALETLRIVLDTFAFELDFEKADTLAGVRRQHRKAVSEAISLLHLRYRERWRVCDMAASFGFSRDHFHRVFKEVTSRTPHQVLTQIRMDHAKDLLRHSGMSIGEIAEHVGYESIFHFSRQFRRSMGCSASIYRSRPHGRPTKR